MIDTNKIEQAVKMILYQRESLVISDITLRPQKQRIKRK